MQSNASLDCRERRKSPFVKSDFYKLAPVTVGKKWGWELEEMPEVRSKELWRGLANLGETGQYTYRRRSRPPKDMVGSTPQSLYTGLQNLKGESTLGTLWFHLPKFPHSLLPGLAACSFQKGLSWTPPRWSSGEDSTLPLKEGGMGLIPHAMRQKKKGGEEENEKCIELNKTENTTYQLKKIFLKSGGGFALSPAHCEVWGLSFFIYKMKWLNRSKDRLPFISSYSCLPVKGFSY